MSEAQIFNVHTIGLSDEDKCMLQRVLRVSSGSVRNFILAEGEEPKSNDLYLVNGDSDVAIAHWCKKYIDAEKKPLVPTVFAGKRKVKGSGIYNIGKPFNASQVISTLNTMTVKEMNFIPELTIGAELKEDNLSESFLEQIVDQEAASGSRYTALVVDDSSAVRKQLEIELKLLGVAVVLAENGEKAMELCRNFDYDIVFLDVVMPGVDGYKVCKFLKKYHRSKSTPVILLTGKSSPFDKVKGSLSGCDSYLTKPLEHENFQHIARKYLSEVRTQQRM